SGQRIEEHGLHVWFGFYENAFRTMRRVYSQLAGDAPPIATYRDWTSAFARRSVWTFEQRVPGAPLHWPVLFPTNGGVPGDGQVGFVSAFAQNLAGWLAHGRRVFIHREDASSRARIFATGALRFLSIASSLGGVLVSRGLEELAALASHR